MSVEAVKKDGRIVSYRVRWRDAGRNRSRVYRTKRDAQRADVEITRRRRLGNLAQLDAGNETLEMFVTNTWGPIHAVELAAATRATYAALYGKHIGPYLGATRLRDLTADQSTRWQAQRAATGAGREAVRRALRLLGGILQRAVEHGALMANPARVVRPIKRKTRTEVRRLAPREVEAIRRQLEHRDAVLVAVLAYAGLRPGEALALRWEDVRERTLLVERAVALGEVKGTKTGPSRAVKLLAPLAHDLAEWRMRSGRPRQRALVFPGRDGGPWSLWDWQHWRNRTYTRALEAADIDYIKPYALRHSFASLLLAEGCSVHYVARQLGHAPSMTLDVYGHVIDELEDSGAVDAEDLIGAERVPADAPVVSIAS